MNLSQVSAPGRAAGLICYTPGGEEELFDGLLPDGFGLVLQRGDGFGERLRFAAEDILACGFGAVCLIDSDSPTVPSSAFQQAISELNRPGDRVVLGGSQDGGYYLIGLNNSHPEIFRDIPWSTASVYGATVTAARGAQIEVVNLPLWYDVDNGATLQMLASELLQNKPPAFANVPGHLAIHTRNFLKDIYPSFEHS